MKYISFIIPCYNSSAYMEKCIKSILVLGDDVEILIIDDGSTKDDTFSIAKKYENKYPNICRAIHKKNGGHGDVLNVGIKKATGKYIKVVDSDDWLDKVAAKKLLNVIKGFVKNKQLVDLVITNFIYDKAGARHKAIMSYHFSLPRNRIISWDQIRIFPIGKYMLMHSLTYRTETLRESNIVLPKHTFYVDNIYAYKPLPYCKKIYYLDVDLYHYFIGRNDQSVNEKVMISRIEQQYKVTKVMLYDVDLSIVKSKKLKHYMLNYMSIIMSVTSVLSIVSNDEYLFTQKEKLWSELRKKNLTLYRELMYTFLGIGVNLPGKSGRKITKAVYRLSQKVYGFN